MFAFLFCWPVIAPRIFLVFASYVGMNRGKELQSLVERTKARTPSSTQKRTTCVVPWFFPRFVSDSFVLRTPRSAPSPSPAPLNQSSRGRSLLPVRLWKLRNREVQQSAIGSPSHFGVSSREHMMNSRLKSDPSNYYQRDSQKIMYQPITPPAQRTVNSPFGL